MQPLAEGTYPHAAPFSRDHRWLENVLEVVWAAHFADTPRVNDVNISFGPAWKNRLGLITLSLDQVMSYIQVNGLLRLRSVPECITRITIAHELVHYAHGFGSPLARRYKHPHRGGVVIRELLA